MLFVLAEFYEYLIKKTDRSNLLAVSSFDRQAGRGIGTMSEIFCLKQRLIENIF